LSIVNWVKNLFRPEGQHEPPELEEAPDVTPPELPEGPIPQVPELVEPDYAADLPKFPPIEEEDYSALVPAPEVIGASGIEIHGSPTGAVVGHVPTEQPGTLLAEGRAVEFGKPTSAFSNGATITLDPCDVDGTDNGAANVVVHTAFDEGSIKRPLATTDVVRFVRYDEPDASDVEGVMIGLLRGTTASPKAIYSTFEGDETAQTDTWDRGSQGANDGVTIPMTTRVVYNETGDEKLYGYYRTLTFDSAGLLTDISAETRYEIDTPVDCTTT